MLCYISGNYMANEFIDSVKTVEGINIKIMLPIAVFFWIIGVLCMYITIKNAIVANEKNLAVMRSLGIEEIILRLILREALFILL